MENDPLLEAAQCVGGQANLARALGVTPAAISQIIAGSRKTPPDRCPAIEHATGGAVKVEDLRPDVRWHRVEDPTWPHPQGRPCIDVAAGLVEHDEASA